MKRFENTKGLTIDDIEESGAYSQTLLDELKNRNFQKLLELPIEVRADIDFMEPLLYAVKNTLDTFQVYEYYSPSLQNNLELASEIVESEPYLLENTPISNNKQFIVENIETNPEIVKYISVDLKKDNDFIYTLINTNNESIKKEIARNCEIEQILIDNPDLCKDKGFMGAAIDNAVELFKYASDELKNDEEFLKVKSSENEDVIDYVVDNVNDFGTDGIKGVRTSSRNFTIEDCMVIIDEMSENSDDKRYAKIKERIKEKGLEDVHTVRIITAMVAQSDKVSPQLVRKVLNYSMLTMEKIKRELIEKGDESININNMQELITPLILNKLKEKLQLNGINIDADLQQKLDDYKKFYDEFHAKFTEKKLNRNKQKLSLADVNEATKNVKISDVNAQIQEMNEEVRNENKEIDGEAKEEK